jgi:hypothetical protein
MQASKIIPRQTYALRIGDFTVRYAVTTVTTINRRDSAKTSPHDYTSHITGWVHKADLPPGVVLEKPDGASDEAENDNRILYRAKPDEVLGLYTEHSELVRREKAERAAAKAREEADKSLASAVRLALYRLVGANDVPSDPTGYGQMFSTNYTGKEVKISDDGVTALARALLPKTDQEAA